MLSMIPPRNPTRSSRLRTSNLYFVYLRYTKYSKIVYLKYTKLDSPFERDFFPSCLTR